MDKYIVTMTTKSNDGVYGKKVHKITTEKIEGITKKGLEKYLKEILDVAIKVGGKAYRPTIADIKSNFKYLTVGITEDEIIKTVLILNRLKKMLNKWKKEGIYAYVTYHASW